MRKNCPRIIIENYYEPCILYLLSQGPNYGYKIQQHIEMQLSCNANISNIYRCLSKLHKDDCVIKTREPSENGPERVVYRITPDGKNLLKGWVRDLKRQKQIVNTLITSCIEK